MIMDYEASFLAGSREHWLEVSAIPGANGEECVPYAKAELRIGVEDLRALEDIREKMVALSEALPASTGLMAGQFEHMMRTRPFAIINGGFDQVGYFSNSDTGRVRIEPEGFAFIAVDAHARGEVEIWVAKDKVQEFLRSAAPSAPGM